MVDKNNRLQSCWSDVRENIAGDISDETLSHQAVLNPLRNKMRAAMVVGGVVLGVFSLNASAEIEDSLKVTQIVESSAVVQINTVPEITGSEDSGANAVHAEPSTKVAQIEEAPRADWNEGSTGFYPEDAVEVSHQTESVSLDTQRSDINKASDVLGQASVTIQTDHSPADAARMEKTQESHNSQSAISAMEISSETAVMEDDSYSVAVERGYSREQETKLEIAYQTDQIATNREVALSINGTARRFESPVASVNKAGGNSGHSENALSDVTGGENAGVPYAIVLAIFALIGLVPVARRNGRI